MTSISARSAGVYLDDAPGRHIIASLHGDFGPFLAGHAAVRGGENECLVRRNPAPQDPFCDVRSTSTHSSSRLRGPVGMACVLALYGRNHHGLQWSNVDPFLSYDFFRASGPPR